MQESTLAKRYASALVDLATEQGVLEAIGQQLADFAQLVETTPSLRNLLESPASDRLHQKAALENVLEKAALAPLMVNFLQLLAQKRRMVLVSEINRAYHRELDKRAGRLTAKVTSATPLADDMVGNLSEALSRVTGKTVSVQLDVEPELLGGLVVQIGSTMMDYSVQNRLNRLKSFMKG
ncbi:MAG: F0F1 ATP synthase subunit delta [Magnetococcales bacterium]|nr:F0F1 ATP synthase subunit delta [Magnetococcales bacterium]NGZ25809.1 F0F1 ATP synthase subunit delta [Magnetococcales bacterium]